MRERLRVAMERVATLEDELSTKGDENSSLKAKLAKVVAEVEEAHQQVCLLSFPEATLRLFTANIYLNREKLCVCFFQNRY